MSGFKCKGLFKFKLGGSNKGFFSWRFQVRAGQGLKACEAMGASSGKTVGGGVEGIQVKRVNTTKYL